MNIEQIITNIIAYSGECTSDMMEAIEYARNSEFENAKNSVKKGNDALLKAHELHTQLLYREANGEKIEVNLLVIHASNHMSNAELLSNLVTVYLENLKVKKC